MAAPHAQGASRRLAYLLAAVSAVGPFCIDAYLPSLTEISAFFGVSMLVAQQSITAYMVPFAAMTIWHGAISDALGRRRVMLVAMAIFAFASLGCALSVSFEMLLFFRALQGVTAGAGMVVGRAVVRDLCDGPEAQRMMSMVTIVFSVAPAIAPVVGGWLHHWFGWRAVFFFMTVFAAGVLAACWVALPESLPRELRQPFRPAFLARSYARTLTSAPFLAASLALALGFAGFFVYVLAAPVFLMRHLHVPETQFLWLFGPITLGMVAGAWLSGRLAGRLAPMQTVVAGLGAMALSVAANLLLALLVEPALPWSVLPLAGYSFGMALVTPSLTLMALDLFPRQRGLAASCQSLVHSAGSALNGALLAPLFWATPLRLAVGQALFFGLAAVAVVVYLFAVRPMEFADDEEPQASSP